MNPEIGQLALALALCLALAQGLLGLCFALYASRGWPLRLQHLALAAGLVLISVRLPLGGYAVASTLNGSPIIDHLSPQPSTEWSSGPTFLAAGQKYDINLEYFERQYGALAKLSWSGPGISKQVIPTQYLYPTFIPPDNQPPTAVRNFDVWYTNDNEIAVSWDGATDNVAVDGYEVMIDNGNWLPVQRSIQTYHFIGLQPGTTHTVSVRAYDTVENRGPVSALTASTTNSNVDNQAPSAVPNFHVANTTDTTATVAWDAASELSRQVHIAHKEKPFQTILSCAPRMYDELWTGGKCMYKLEPVLADGGELIIYAPHITEVCVTHGKVIEEIGYHCRDYFLKQWDKFKHVPWGVLAHSTHVRGIGIFKDGVEHCRVQVTLASQVPEVMCKKINLGYRDHRSIDVEDWRGQEDEGRLCVPKAGETLYLPKPAARAFMATPPEHREREA